VVAVLAVILGMVTMYVLASNSVSQRKAELASLNQQVAQTQAETGALTKYAQFTQLAQTRSQTVRDIAASRFDWAATMTELSEVIPANTTLQSLTASVDPSATAGNSSSAGSALRGDIAVPAFELVGCTGSQDDVAGLMSRLRLINGVTRVTLSDAVKNIVGAAGSSTATSPLTCRPGSSTFDVVVFFSAPAGAPATGVPGATPTSATTTTPAATPTTPPASTPIGGTS
jgi:Tfp pilus assembly protein PilN